MAIKVTAGTDYDVVTDTLADGTHVQYVKLMDGTDDGTGVIKGDATNGLDVDVTRIAAGDNNIGNVDIVTMPAVVLGAGTAEIGKLAAGTANIGDVDIASIAAGEAHIGFVASNDTVITISASCSTDALAEGDVAFATQEVALAARVNGGTTILQTVTIADPDDQGIGVDLIFFNANTTLGTENSAPDIDDTELLTVVGRVQIGAGSFYDLGTGRIACVSGIGMMMKAGAATTSLYVAGIARGAPTYAGGTLQIQLGFMRN